jgi:hypothetical protein
MSKVKNISGGPLDVPLLGRSVEADEVAEVPDFQPAHSDENPLPITWPPDKWEYVSEHGPELTGFHGGEQVVSDTEGM